MFIQRHWVTSTSFVGWAGWSWALLLLFVLAITFISEPASATITVYDNRATFQAAAAPITIYGFETHSLIEGHDYYQDELPTPITSFTATQLGDSFDLSYENLNSFSINSGGGVGVVDGTRSVFTHSMAPSSVVSDYSLTFSNFEGTNTPIKAFGLTVTDFASFITDPVSITYDTGSLTGTLLSVTGGQPSYTQNFVGVIVDCVDDMFSSITLTFDDNLSGTQWFDEVIYAAPITWRGGTTDWHSVNNWDPISLSPTVIWRVPTDGDTAMLSDTTHGTLVTLSDNTDEIDGLWVTNGIDLKTSGYLLHVSELATACTRIDGSESKITVDKFADDHNDRAFDTDYLSVENGGALVMNDGISDIDIRADIDSSSSILGLGKMRFGTGTAVSPGDTVLQNDGTIQVDHTLPSATLILEAHNDGELDLDGTSGIGILDVDDSGTGLLSLLTLVVDGQLADSFSGTLLIGRGDTADFRQAWNASLADVEFNGKAGAATLTGADATVNWSTFVVNSGKAVVENGLVFQTGTFDVDASLQLDGNATFHNGAQLDLDGASGLIINGTTVITENAPDRLDLDSDSEKNTITINNGASLVLRVEDIDDDTGDDIFNGTVTINGGDFDPKISGGWESGGLITLEDGELTGTHLTNTGEIEGYGMVKAAGLVNESVIAARFGGTLVLENSAHYFNLGGSSNNGEIDAIEGDIEIRNTFAPFRGTMFIESGHEVFVNGGFGLGEPPDPGLLAMNNGTMRSTVLNQYGILHVNGTSPSTIEVSDIVVFGDLAGNPSVNEINADLQLVGDSLIRTNAAFLSPVSPGRLINTPGSTMQTVNSANLDVTLRNEGELIIGTIPAAGRLTVANYQQSASGVLPIQIGGTLPNQYDHIIVNDTAELDGDIIVSLIGGFSPAICDSFDIIIASGGIIGTFHPIPAFLPPLPANGRWDIFYYSDRVALKVFYAADFDSDCDVDGNDFLIWSRSYGIDDGGDADGDGDTDQADLLIWKALYGSSCSCPEPASLAFALIGLAAACVVRQKRGR